MSEMAGEPYDWADDDSISGDETIRRFNALNPSPTTGPRRGVRLNVSSGVTVRDNHRVGISIRRDHGAG